MTASNSIPFPIPAQFSPYVLYRFFDADGALIYVGITNKLRRRCEEHRIKGWFVDVVRVEIMPFDSRSRAAAAEADVIAACSPKHNRTANRGGPIGKERQSVLLRTTTVQIPVPMYEWLTEMADDAHVNVGEIVLRCIERAWEMDGITPDLSMHRFA